MKKTFFHLKNIFFFSLLFLGVFFAFFQKRVQWLCDASINAEFATVCAQEAGFIKHLNLKEGDKISEGFLLFELDNTLLKTEINQKQKQIDRLKKQANQQKKQIDQLTQEYISLRSDFERKKISEEDLKAHLDQLTKAQKNYENFLSNLDVAVSENEVLNIKLHQKQSHSPISGVIVKKWKNIGESVNPSDPIFSICNLDKIWIDAYVSEEIFSRLYKNNEVLIQSSAFSDSVLKGKVVFFGIGKTYEKDQKIKIPIKISIPSSSEITLRPGMSVKVGIS